MTFPGVPNYKVLAFISMPVALEEAIIMTYVILIAMLTMPTLLGCNCSRPGFFWAV
jgi:hypothetical protein